MQCFILVFACVDSVGYSFFICSGNSVSHAFGKIRRRDEFAIHAALAERRTVAKDPRPLGGPAVTSTNNRAVARRPVAPSVASTDDDEREKYVG